MGARISQPNFTTTLLCQKDTSLFLCSTFAPPLHHLCTTFAALGKSFAALGELFGGTWQVVWRHLVSRLGQFSSSSIVLSKSCPIIFEIKLPPIGGLGLLY